MYIFTAILRKQKNYGINNIKILTNITTLLIVNIINF